MAAPAEATEAEEERKHCIKSVRLSSMVSSPDLFISADEEEDKKLYIMMVLEEDAKRIAGQRRRR